MARKTCNFTLDKLAERAGLAKSFLSEIENKHRNCSIGTIVALSDALGVSVEWLIRGRERIVIKCPYCSGSGKLPL